MPDPVEVNCPVQVPEALAFGQFANSVRLLKEGKDECLLDFCVFSAQANQAVVVARVRVKTDFLPILMHRLQLTLLPPQQQQQKPVSALMAEVEFKNGQAELPDGRILVFGGGGDEEN